MKKFTLFIQMALLCAFAYGQQINNIVKLHAEKNMVLNVKQFNQFIKRFNYEEDFYGNPLTENFKKKINRSNYILLLFNIKDPKLFDTVYVNQMGEFIQLVVNDSIKIDRLSDNNFAFAKCQINYKKDPETLFLVLNFEKVFRGYRWALFDAYCNFIPAQNKLIDTTPIDSPKLKFIPPTSNEVNFSHLRIVFEDINDLPYYTSNKNRGARLTALIDIIKLNDIKFNYVEKLKYYIFDIPGWVVEVSEFIRDDKNSGWLISNIWKNNEKARNYMLNEIESLIKL
jgi:hypothetical protein